ncbi:MurR/RpiR family transcriptional regulator [Variovorax terrae]|uniref:MurR/RpiR family transcriptional regulator n=1 Tax=Variovorax terrae TaxID=2923278 RepID=A0A9X1VUH4_9BURK|nr:MurR/RpiR family transcriptional regulator [Variovorax terrae]MCJ0763480.1 MurR/RpiR family transcriptional regulator [Variovorax terrae]
MNISLSDCLALIESHFSQMGPELQRCARWVADHPREVGLLSMRQQAQQAGATPTSMIRMARTLGFDDYTSFRRPFQDALATPVPDYRARARSMQAAGSARPADRLEPNLEGVQIDNVRSAGALNQPSALDRAVDAMLRARQVAFLGVRSCFAISYHFHYAYSLIAGNGLLVHGLGGAFPDQVDVLDERDLLVCITQQPYGRPTIEALQACHARGVKVLTLTDSPLSPAAAYSDHLLQFRADSPSYFHSMLGSLALVEGLLARLTTRGGQAVLDRLSTVESRLASSKAYWNPPTTSRSKK